MDLGSMDIQQLTYLLIGTVFCAGFMVVFILGYLVISRRQKRARTRVSTGVLQEVQSKAGTKAASPVAPVLSSPTEEKSQVGTGASVRNGDVGAETFDVGARLAHIGRDAWQHPSELDQPVAPRFRGREVLRVVRDGDTGRVWVKVAGARYSTLNDIRDQTVGDRVLRAITFALRFSGGVVLFDKGPGLISLPPIDRVQAPEGFGALSENTEDGELIRLLSDGEAGFWVQTGEGRFSRLAEVTDREAGTRILESISRLLQFSRGRLVTNQGVAAVAVPDFEEEPSRPSKVVRSPDRPGPSSSGRTVQDTADMEPKSTEMRAAQEQFLEELSSGDWYERREPTLSRGRMGGRKAGPEKRPSSASKSSGFSLVEEINRVFQSKLAASPLAGEDVEIVERVDGSVGIRVGSTHYASVEDLPNPELARIIKSAIESW